MGWVYALPGLKSWHCMVIARSDPLNFEWVAPKYLWVSLPKSPRNIYLWIYFSLPLVPQLYSKRYKVMLMVSSGRIYRRLVILFDLSPQRDSSLWSAHIWIFLGLVDWFASSWIYWDNNSECRWLKKNLEPGAGEIVQWVKCLPCTWPDWVWSSAPHMPSEEWSAVSTTGRPQNMKNDKKLRDERDLTAMQTMCKGCWGNFSVSRVPF